MRCYHFGNMYMSSIQQGIQAAHAQMELFNKYVPQTDEDSIPEEIFTQLFDWSKNHKTMICLNGGYLETMQELYDFMNVSQNPYPFSNFHEAKETMNGMLTNVAIVLPEKIYEVAKLIRSNILCFSNETQHVPKPGLNNNNPETKNEIYFTLEIQKDKEPLSNDFIKNLLNQEYTLFEKELILRLNTFNFAI